MTAPHEGSIGGAMNPLEQAKEILERGEKASEGPWRSNCAGSEGYYVRPAEGDKRELVRRIAYVGYRSMDEDRGNADFIAFARTAAPAVAQALIELVEVAGCAAVMPCPNDTNGDGDCGRRFCPFCGVDGLRATLSKITEQE